MPNTYKNPLVRDLDKLAKQSGISSNRKYRWSKLRKQEKYDLLRKLMAGKLCRCISKVIKSSNKTAPRYGSVKYKRENSRAIAICKKSIFKNRGWKASKHNCYSTRKYERKNKKRNKYRKPKLEFGLS